MIIDLAFTPHELEKKELAGKSVVVIDALRADRSALTAPMKSPRPLNDC
jgi:hypothetical protein